ncbi:MAG: trypsin-like peptidase domain-containing protein [Isosphaeraceae bacterium]
MKRNAVAWAALLVSTAALISSRGVTKPVPAQERAALNMQGQREAAALSEAFGAVAEHVRPSVVQISVDGKGGVFGRGNPNGPGPNNINPKQLEELLKRFMPDFKLERQQLPPSGRFGQGTGSGFIYDDHGHILTNNHVVDGADRIQVSFYDGETASAKVVGRDPEADVAVIKVDRTDYPALERGKSARLKVGEWVMAVGSPFGLSQTVTAGIISATDRTPEINEFEDFLQTDAAINPGNSGGPLVDMNGKVIGINSAIATASRANAGVGFAIPIDMAGRIADKLIKDGKISRSAVGILLENLTPARAKELGAPARTPGVLVGKVTNGSPAEKAGVRTGDIITQFDHEPVHSVSGFRNLVAVSDTGKSYDLTYLRNGKEQTTRVAPAPLDEIRLANQPAPPPNPGRRGNRGNDNPKPEAPGGRVSLEGYGMSVQPLSPALAQQLGYEGKEGVLIASVQADGPAAEAGLEAGDLITKVVKDKKPVVISSPKELGDLAKKSDEVVIMVEDVNKVLDPQMVTLGRQK